MGCLFGIMCGMFALGGITSNIKCVLEGLVAGKLAYEIIDRIPLIKLDDPETRSIGNL